MSVLRTRGLTKRFGDLVAVDGVDLAVSGGEVFGFLGPNGAGKSTTINMLLDFIRPTAGDISVVGYDPQVEPRAVRECVGVLPEAYGYRERASARAHVEFAIEMKRADDDPEDLLDRVGIAEAAERSVEELSKGMRQRLGLAIALVDDPELLILDEPLGGLDPEGARLLRDIVRAERDRGAAVFFSSHIMEQVETLCDRVGIMHAGGLVAVDTVDGLRARSERQEPVVVTVHSLPDGSWRAEGDGVVDITHRTDGIRITCRDASAAGAVIGRLDAAGVTIRAIDTEGTSLEDIFMAVTGDDSHQSPAEVSSMGNG